MEVDGDALLESTTDGCDQVTSSRDRVAARSSSSSLPLLKSCLMDSGRALSTEMNPLTMKQELSFDSCVKQEPDEQPSPDSSRGLCLSAHRHCTV